MNELERFIQIWDREAAKTARVLGALPEDQYDFRPDRTVDRGASWPGI